MDVEDRIRDQIIAATTLVGSRVYPIKLPQQATFPAVRYIRISAIRDYTHSGRDCLPAARFQIDVFDDSYTGVRAAWDEVRKALDGYSGVGVEYITLDNETDDYEDRQGEAGQGLYRVIGDFVVQYVET